ncbi:hypothetical protein BJY24_002659 [Nocardia transvalensis]|uniref:Uncharacterized protein n=1 Tax=Nocardia transvalensis TaxID=37333 RepID=A0A7W9PCT1_9NOCA|nr:hypothetical protein [Nocardia transvalensis]
MSDGAIRSGIAAGDVPLPLATALRTRRAW